MKFLDLVVGIFKPAADLIDALHTSEEEKLQKKNELLQIQAAAMDAALTYEKDLMNAKANIVHAEASSEHWLTATWRPIVMLGLFSLVMLDSFGWLPNRLSNEAWMLLQIGLGGYVVGRSVEKGIKTFKQP